MRWLSLSVAVALGACGSSQNDGADNAGASGGGAAASGGAAGANDSGAAGGSKGTGGSGGAPGTGGSGGAPGTGGSSGSGGTPAVDGGPTVLPCSNLPSATQWEPITPTDDTTTCATDADCTNAGMDCTHCVRSHCDYGDSQMVQGHPLQSGTIYVGMHRCNNGNHRPTDGLYKSTDCGATWLPRISVGANGDAFGNGSLWSFAIDPVDPDVIFAITGYGAGGVWKSTNGGVDWNNSVSNDVGQYVPGQFFQALSMDPTDHRHLVATAHVNCNDPYGPGSCLAETTDSGATWRLIKVSWSWIEGAGPFFVNSKTIGVTAGFGGIKLSTDDGATWNTLAVDATGAALDATGAGYGGGVSLPRSPNGTYFLPSLNGVLRSDDGLSWSMIPNSGGRCVGFAVGEANLYSGDQWARNYHTATVADPTKWTSFTIAGMPANDGQGAPFMAYDLGHHILYSSNFAGGLWRIVTP